MSTGPVLLLNFFIYQPVNTQFKAKYTSKIYFTCTTAMSDNQQLKVKR